MSAKINKNGITTCSPMEGYDVASILKNDIVVNENIFLGFDTSFSTCNNGTFNGFVNQINGGTVEVVSRAYGVDKVLHIHSLGGQNRVFKLFSAHKNESYTFSADYFSETDRSIALRIELYGGDYNWNGANKKYISEGGWQRLSVTVNNLTSDTDLYCMIYCSDDVYVKNLKLENSSIPTSWTPSGYTPQIQTSPIKANEFYEY